jgi:hypothetical protein
MDESDDIIYVVQVIGDRIDRLERTIDCYKEDIDRQIDQHNDNLEGHFGYIWSQFLTLLVIIIVLLLIVIYKIW